MKKLLAISILLVSASAAYSMSVKQFKTRAPASSTIKNETLEFISLKQFPNEDRTLKFDLSGLAQHADKSIFVISDKERTPFIYKVDWDNAKLIPYIPFNIKDKLDIEAIDICEEDFYLSNEKNDQFYIARKDQETEKLNIDISISGLKSNLFSGNQGFEGMAIDCANQIMYATKERQPRFILTIDLKTKKAIKKWDIHSPGTLNFDFSDAKYQNGYLYVLERTSMVVTKIDVKTEKIVAKYSYQNIEKGTGYLFGPAIYSFAEALVLTPDEIWIGFDNNGLRATQDAKKDLGIKNRDPLIVRFKRPAQF